MVDLETLDTRPSAIILSIGACLVDWGRGVASEPFYRVIEVESCREVGLTESSDTRAWWDKQSPEARKVFTDPGIKLIEALCDFSDYLKPFGRTRIWGNGSDFDNVILANAYDALGLDAPWKFWDNRCFRTVKNIHKGHIKESTREGTYHNALDDAIHQANMLLQCRSILGQ